ncbi:hypothetical protein [uncultured Nocardioides sp.]|uniref:hypothetical protein n=1 Tax=uncultured Nocardioides sp. TaxID=198441 RepID=UPI00344C2C13
MTYALCVEEIARGWMRVSGVITHFIVTHRAARRSAPRFTSRARAAPSRPACRAAATCTSATTATSGQTCRGSSPALR